MTVVKQFDPVAYFRQGLENSGGDSPPPIEIAYHLEEEILRRQKEDIEANTKEWEEYQAAFELDQIEIINPEADDISNALKELEDRGAISRDDAAALEARFPGIFTSMGLAIESFTPHRSKINYEAGLEAAKLGHIAVILIAVVGTLVALVKWANSDSSPKGEIGEFIRAEKELAKIIEKRKNNVNALKEALGDMPDDKMKEIITRIVGKDVDISDAIAAVTSEEASKGTAMLGVTVKKILRSELAQIPNLAEELHKHGEFLKKSDRPTALAEYITSMNTFISDTSTKLTAITSSERTVADAAPKDPKGFLNDFAVHTAIPISNAVNATKEADAKGSAILLDKTKGDEYVERMVAKKDSTIPNPDSLKHLDDPKILEYLRDIINTLDNYKKALSKDYVKQITEVVKKLKASVDDFKKEAAEKKADKADTVDSLVTGINDTVGIVTRYYVNLTTFSIGMANIYGKQLDVQKAVLDKLKNDTEYKDDDDKSEAEQVDKTKDQAANVQPAPTAVSNDSQPT